MEYDRLTIYVDGAVWGNPGPAGIAGIIFKDKVEIEHFNEYIGEATNNEAEYKALIFALERAKSLEAQAVLIYSDSELLVKQLMGVYKVKSSHLKHLFEQVKVISSRFSKVEVKHISREENNDADRLANQAIEEYQKLDRRGDFVPQSFGKKDDSFAGSKSPRRGFLAPHPFPAPHAKAIISFLSDFGLADGWVGICKGVIKSINPDAQIIDISHDIPNYDIKKGAFVLASAVPFIKAQVYMGVVDPGVGGLRRSIAIKTEQGSFLVGPDNGMLIPAASRLGGITQVVELTNRNFMLEPVCQTFHGRDIFAPVAAHITLGTDIEKMGSEIAPGKLAKPPWKAPELTNNTLRTQVIDIDKFGTVHLNVSIKELDQLNIALHSKIKLTWDKNQKILPLLETFNQVGKGEALLLIDSSSFLSIAINQGSAAQKLNLKLGDTVIIQPKSNTIKKLNFS